MIKGGEKMYKDKTESCGKRIATALKLKGIKQSDLCKLANIPKSSLSLYLSGAYEPKQDRVYSIAKALNVNEAWLMGYDVPMETKKEPSPISEPLLTEEEKKWMEIYHRLSNETREMLITSLDELDTIDLEQQQLVLDLIRVALKNRK
jgi:transcriptional regulator with XRE-family HTH domain